MICKSEGSSGPCFGQRAGSSGLGALCLREAQCFVYNRGTSYELSRAQEGLRRFGGVLAAPP